VLTGEVGEVDVARLADVTGASEREQVGDGALEAVGDAQRGLELLAGGRRIVERRQLVQAQSHRGQRGAELMRDIGRELPLAADELGDLHRGGVECGGDVVQLGQVEPAGPGGEVARAESGRRGDEALQRADEAPRLEDGGARRRRRCRRSPGRRRAARPVAGGE